MSSRVFVHVFAVMLLLAPLVTGAQDRPAVYVVNYPLQYFAGRIAGDLVDVVFPVPPGEDPAFWRPDAEAVSGYQQADLILLNGAGYAKWINRVSLPRSKTVDTSRAFRDRFIATEGGASHSHGREGEHAHAGTAFTTWLDFNQAAAQANAVRDALSRLLPRHATTFDNNFAALEQDLADLDARMKEAGEGGRTAPLFASHPVYQYLARRYSLNLKEVLWEPDVMPPESEWQMLKSLLDTHPAKWIIWEGEPSADAVNRLRHLGIQSTVFDPCGNRPETGDFLSVMENNVQNIKPLLR